MDERRPANQTIKMIFLFLLVVALPLLVGLRMAPRLVPTPEIGIVRLSYDINSYTTNEITAQLAYARQTKSVKAVVLIINSPGGSAAYSEELYLDVLNTRQDVPVIATIDLLAASGAYYMAAAANEIYAKPTSGVGSVGVIAFLPGPVFLEEELLTTGPYKAFGGTRDGTVRQIEVAKEAFLEAVAVGRGDTLQIDLDVLSRAEVYTGVQAEELGLIDGLISNDEAIQRAADLAGLSHYEVVELYPIVFPDSDSAGPVPFFQYQPAPIDSERLWASPTDLPPGLYYRYMELPSR